jgi:hypothetical protein
MMTNEEKTTLTNAANELNNGAFVHIHGYVNAEGEKSNVTFHAGANYERVHANSLVSLESLVSDPNLTIDICWNFWQDADGNRYSKKGKKTDERESVIGFKETVSLSDPDCQQAIEELRKSITDPTKRTSDGNYEKIGKSVYENGYTGKVYFRNVLVHSKEVVEKIEYKPTYTTRVNAIKKELTNMLPVSKYRSYVIDTDATVTVKRGEEEVKIPKYEYISIFHERVSSSSSSSED